MVRRIVLALGVVLAGCAKQESQEPLKHYTLQGEVVSIDSQAKTAVIKHDEIKGWMEAMTMPFPVRPPERLSELKPGQKITARVNVQGLDFWLDEVKNR